jgi:anti-sigma factor RsiW
VHLRGEQLISYLDGEAHEAIKQHIDACSSCAAYLEPFIVLQRNLLKALYRLHCPGSQAWGDCHLGLLTEAKALAVSEHLAECPYCGDELEALQQSLAQSELPAGRQAEGRGCIYH